MILLFPGFEPKYHPTESLSHFVLDFLVRIGLILPLREGLPESTMRPRGLPGF